MDIIVHLLVMDTYMEKISVVIADPFIQVFFLIKIYVKFLIKI